MESLLQNLHQTFRKADNDIINYNLFYGPEANLHRRNLFTLCLNDGVLDENNKELEYMNKIYLANQHLCWKSHEHHFHIAFVEYLTCPVTCLYEIVEWLEKIRGEYNGE